MISTESYWGARAADWAELQERHSEPLFEAALAKCRVGEGTALLDVGCGSGGAAHMAAQRSARVAGLDGSQQMIEIARRRTPSGDFRVGDMQTLPWPSRSFDVVTCFNSLQYAVSPVDALREAARVTRPRGHVAVAAWAEPVKCQAAPYIAALGSLLPPPPSGDRGPWAFSPETALRGLIESAGLRMTAMREVTCAWIYADSDTAVRALMAGGSAARAIELAGETKVRNTIRSVIEPFRRHDGSYRLENVFRLALADV